MDISAITTAIATVGFPVVMSGALFWYLVTQRESHKEEVNHITEALNNNTLALQRLVDVVGKNGNDR